MTASFRALSFNAEGERIEPPLNLQEAIRIAGERIETLTALSLSPGGFSQPPNPEPEGGVLSGVLEGGFPNENAVGVTQIGPRTARSAGLLVGNEPQRPTIGFPNETLGPGDAELLELQNAQRESFEARFRIDDDRTPGSNTSTEQIVSLLKSDDPRVRAGAVDLFIKEQENRAEYQRLLALGGNGVRGDTARDLLDLSGVNQGGFDEAGRDERLATILEAGRSIDDRLIAGETERQETEAFEGLERRKEIIASYAEELGLVRGFGEDIELRPDAGRSVSTENEIVGYMLFKLQDQDELSEAQIQRGILEDNDLVAGLVVNDPLGVFAEGEGLELRNRLGTASDEEEVEAGIREAREFLSTRIEELAAGIVEIRNTP